MMTIIMRDGKQYNGSPLNIIKDMKHFAFYAKGFSIPEYIRSVVQGAAKWEGKHLVVTGETEDELALSLVEEMIRVGLANRGICMRCANDNA